MEFPLGNCPKIHNFYYANSKLYQAKVMEMLEGFLVHRNSMKFRR